MTSPAAVSSSPSNPSHAEPSRPTPSERTEEGILPKVRGFLQENFLYLRPADFHLGVDDRLLEQGVIDSMGVVEMITFLEDMFAIRVSEDEISEANLGTLSAIAKFVMAKQTAAAS